MTTYELKKAISILYDMELNNYMMENCINEIKNKILTLGKKELIQKPVYISEHFVEEKADTTSIVIASAMLFGFIGCIIGWIEACKFESGLDLIIFVPIGVIYYGAIGAVIGAFLSLFIVPFEMAKTDKRNKKKRDEADCNAKRRYNNEMQQYNKQLEKSEKLLREELAMKRSLEIDMISLKEQLDESKWLLNAFYNRIGLDENYRNLVAIGYMKELITIEAATELKGINGLYYLTRKELRMDNLESVLNNISTKLDRVIAQNNRLYAELQQITREGKVLFENSVGEAQKQLPSNNHEINGSNTVERYNYNRTRKQEEYKSFINRLR